MGSAVCTHAAVKPQICLSVCLFSLSYYLSHLLLQCSDGRPLSSRDRHNLQELEAKLQVLRRRGRHLEIAERNCCTKVASALRPIKVGLPYGHTEHIFRTAVCVETANICHRNQCEQLFLFLFFCYHCLLVSLTDQAVRKFVSGS